VSKERFIIIGAGGHARTIIDSLNSIGKPIEGVLDIDFKGIEETIMGVKVLGSYEELLSKYGPDDFLVALALGDNSKRADEFDKLSGLGYLLPPIAHSTSIISESATLGDASLIAQGAIIGPMANIGEDVIINTGAIVDHESVVGAHSHICPGVCVAGRVNIGSRTFIGIGSSIIDRINIGDNVTVGAGSVVVDNVETDTRVAGVPAEKLS
jgi:UDP-perosamine 4-acetyltransferase